MFINETISDADKAKVDWKQFTLHPTANHGLIRPHLWTVDKEKRAFFVILAGGRPDGPSPTYGFSWKGFFIRVVTKAQHEWAQKKQVFGIFLISKFLQPLKANEAK